MSFTTTHGVKDLTGFASIESALFVEWAIPNLSVKYLSDWNVPVTVDGNIYTSLGELLTITQATSELRASGSQLSVSLSGVPDGLIEEVLSNDIKGSNLKVSRTYANKQGAEEGSFILFNGIVTNYSINSTVDTNMKTELAVITLVVNNAVDILSNNVSGRRTNPQDFPNDEAFARIRLFKDRLFGFGGANK